jgi:hypothetical protein
VACINLPNYDSMPVSSSSLLFSTALLAICFDASASQCVYRAKTDDARVVRFSGEVLTPENWTVDAQCERLEVVSGTVRVMAQGAGSKLGETEVSAGPLLKPGQGIADNLLRQIRVLLAGDARSRTGMSRAGADVNMLAEVLPAGLLVDHGTPLAIALPDPDGMRGAMLVLTPDTGAPLRVPAKDGVLQIPAAALRAPAHYRWHFTAPGAVQKALDGEFGLVTPATFAAVKDGADAQAKAAPGAGNATDALTVADKLIEQGYVQEARTVLAGYLLK